MDAFIDNPSIYVPEVSATIDDDQYDQWLDTVLTSDDAKEIYGRISTTLNTNPPADVIKV